MEQIKNRYTGEVISEGETFREAAEKAESLRGANLRGVDMIDSDLRGVDLSDSDLRGSDLCNTDLSYVDLRFVDMRGVDMRGVRFCNTVGNMREIKSLQLDTYAITYTADRLQIGCENHAISEWWEFDDETIAAMDTGALDWWRVWKPIFQQIIETSPATPTGKEA